MNTYAATLKAETNYMDLAKTAPTPAARAFWYRKALSVR